jgi:hypothetical protein
MRFRQIGRFALIAVLSMIAILPAAVRFPTQIGLHDITPLLLGLVLIFDASMLALAARRRGRNAKVVLNFVARLAVISVGAVLLMKFVRYPRFNVPSAQALTTVMHLDGGAAYDADVFELYGELWLFVAGLFMLGNFGWRRWRQL